MEIMKSQHMTQQTFANFVGIAPATLSSIVNERTKPTLNIIEAIKSKLPSISTDWLMFGNGSMYVNDSEPEDGQRTPQQPLAAEPSLFSNEPQSVSQAPLMTKNVEREVVKYIDKPQRKITEIRIFYDDQTWETFVAKK